MKIEIVQRNYAAKEKLTDLIDKKVQKFEKYLGDGASAKVVLSKTGALERYKMEISLKGRNTFVRSEVQTDNMYANLDLCLAKLERQVIKIAGKNKDNNKIAVDPATLLFFDEIPEVEPAKIVKHKEFELDRISDEQAVEQIELLDNSFYIYKDMETGNVNVLYRRADGDYGVIKTK